MLRALLLLLLLTAATTAAAADADELLARLVARAAELPSLRQTFVQEQHLALLDEPITGEGLIEIDRHLGAVRWEWSGRAVLILRDGRLRRWAADGRAEQPGVAAGPLAAQMQALLDGDWSALAKSFAIEVIDQDTAPGLLLRPHEAALAEAVAAVRVRFRPDLDGPAEIRVDSGSGDHTLYRFAAPAAVALDPARFAAP